MKTNICPLCLVVSASWLLMSAGMALGYLSPAVWLVPVALLMGGTVVGIAYLGEKRCSWASKNPLAWKSLVVVFGMPTAYLLATHISKAAVVLEFFLLCNIAFFLFAKQQAPRAAKPDDEERVRETEKQLEQCC